MAAPRPKTKIPELVAGDHLDQKTFHERYEAMPDGVKAELIGGVVYLSGGSTRVLASHGSRHSGLIGWLWSYKVRTPGVDVFDNATTILGKCSEPQPDASLVVLREYCGQSQVNDDGYLEGAPELAAEVALSSESYDLHEKLRDYERAGVQEYLVVILKQQQIVWHVRNAGRPAFDELKAGTDGILRSPFFGGLWLNPNALLRNDDQALLATIERGIGSPEHKEFVQTLARRK